MLSLPEWSYGMQKTFDKVGQHMAANAVTAYQDHNKLFDISNAASDFKLGTCIIQEVRPVTNFSKKLLNSNCNYAVMELKMI